jgi:hypothetical protein
MRTLKFPAEVCFIYNRALTTVTMLWASYKCTLYIFSSVSFNITPKRHLQSNFTTPPAQNLIKESLWKMSVGTIHSGILCTFGLTNTKFWEATSEVRNTVIPTCRHITCFCPFAYECYLLRLSQNHWKPCIVNTELINRKNLLPKKWEATRGLGCSECSVNLID